MTKKRNEMPKPLGQRTTEQKNASKFNSKVISTFFLLFTLINSRLSKDVNVQRLLGIH